MGSRIAAQMANAGAEVVLLDIVPRGANDRSKLAKEALENMKKGNAFTHPCHAEQITPGNLEDDLEQLSDASWIVEAVVENLQIKQDLYARLQDVRKRGSILSSNTSTLPLKQLKDGLPEELRRDLCITHFFNPPRQMRLLELVTDAENDNEQLQTLTRFIDDKLGKTVVYTKDTPGFIANRIGVFWMMWGLEKAIEQHISVELADALLGQSLGFPKTGIFGLMDLVGLDLMLDITKSLQDKLPKDDVYQKLNQSVRLLKEMVNNEQTGNKGDGGFYRKKDGGRQVFDLQKKTYRDVETPEDEAIHAAKHKGLHATLETASRGGRYTWAVLSEILRYSAALVPEVAKEITSVDSALTLGFNWQRGPFEIIDALGNACISGSSWFAENLKKDDRNVPELLKTAAEKQDFYKEDGSTRHHLGNVGSYQSIDVPEGRWKLADKTRGRSPVIENDAAKLWDVGDGIACLQLVTNFNTIDDETFDMVEQTIEKVQSDFQGLIIGDDDQHFSAGLNLHKILEWCEKEDWKAIEAILERGQQNWMALKYAPFPVVGAAYGKVLGGACELLLHCDAIQAHIESHIGLVEISIGLVPGWGGCKEMLLHHVANLRDASSQLQASQQVFNLIANATPTASAEEARDRNILHEGCGVSMNRARVLADAKLRCCKLAQNYLAPDKQKAAISLAATRLMFDKEIASRVARNDLHTHEKRVLQCLAFVLSSGNSSPDIMQQMEMEAIQDRGDDADLPSSISEVRLLELERKAFMTMIKSYETQAKIKEVLSC